MMPLKWRGDLQKKKAYFVGMSSGAAMHVAVEIAKKLDSGTIVVLLPDGGERYLSTTLFEEYGENGT
jgi:cysteinyl-tRNA synthetase